MAACGNRHITEGSFFQGLSYSTCWEDPTVLQEALQVGEGDVVLSITSGGCNTLSLLLHDPARIMALDFNPNQNHFLRLKIAGIRGLPHSEFLELLGVRSSDRRLRLYRAIRKDLPVETCRFWDRNRDILHRGALMQGKQERYIAGFGRLLRVIFGRKRVEGFFRCRSLKEQERYFERAWDGLIWRSLFDVFFSKAIMHRAKDPAIFRFVEEENYGRTFRKRAEWALTRLPIRENYFLAFGLLGRYLNEEAMPPYLLARNFEYLRECLDRIEIVTGDLVGLLKSTPPRTFTRFNLSNIFDWLTQEEFVAQLREVCRTAVPDSRMCYWNTLIRRPLPAEVPEIESRKELAEELLRRDRAFAYANLEIGIIRGQG
jgi:S-adenosylmethionine-diacylglycerol 3-amino-3-carboxypropyl transferase